MRTLRKSVKRSVARKAPKARRLRVRRPMSQRAVALTARQEVNRMIETQDGTDRTTDTLIGSMQCTPWAVNDQVWCVTPNTSGNKGIVISQGSGEADRKGNKIRTANAVIRITGVMEPYNATTNPAPKPQVVRWFVISAKRGVKFNDAGDVSAIRNDLYESGNNTAPATGNIFDTTEPLNTDKYVIHRAGTFKVFWSEYIGTGGAGSAAGNGTNNDFKYMFHKNINLTKYCPKVIQYIDANASPVSKPVWFCMYTVPADGTTPGVLVTPIRVRVTQIFKFKDL